MTHNPSAIHHPDIVWITGASSGIGKECARGYARQGYRVALTARSEEKLNALAEEIGPQAIVCAGDITDSEAMQAIVTHLTGQGHLALALLNAGIYIPVNGADPELESYHKTFAVNLTGTVNCLIPALQAMKKQPLQKGMGGVNRGKIAVVASVAGYFGLPKASAYGASKAALINLCESLRWDVKKTDVAIQLINPGFVETPATDVNDFKMPFLMQPEEAAERIVKGTKKKAFEVTFPKRFTYLMKAVQKLPYVINLS
jgi:short-subunit dehydrogenase